MTRIYVNNFVTTIEGTLSSLDSSSDITLTSAVGLPVLNPGEYMRLTLDDGAGNIEIIEFESRTGNVLNDAIRGVEDSTKHNWADGSIIECRATAEGQLNVSSLGFELNELMPQYPDDNSPTTTSRVVNLDGSDNIVLSDASLIADTFLLKSNVSTASWVNDTDDTLAVSDTLIPTNEMVKAYVDASGGGGGASDSFKTIAVSGQSDVVADSATDTLTLVAGSNITLTTNATTDTITIAASGGGGGSGDFVGPASSADSEVVLFDGATGKLAKRPGTAGMIVPAGDTSSRGSTNNQVRMNTELFHMEARIAGSWSGNQFLMDSDFPATGIMARTAALTYAGRTITAGTGINVSNGDGVSGNPTISCTVVGVSDGDKGDITVSSTGTVWSIDTPSSTTIATNDKILLKDTSATDAFAYATAQSIRDLVPGSGTLTSAQLATSLTDETGTGANVFATSPTLVTPILGTPTSVTLTNATGLPISTGVSGLGTGVATFLATPSSANLRTALTDETGTGSAVFATSPTLVTPDLGTPSAGVLTNCTGYPEKIVQQVNTNTAAVASGTTAMPFDDTIPQITEGNEFMTVTITPTSASNKLVIQVCCMIGSSSLDYVTVGLFQNSTANAIAATSFTAFGTDAVQILPLNHVMTAGTTSAITFRVRAGKSSGTTTTFNGVSAGSRRLGGVASSSIIVTEYSV